jgi:hypothetical protein
MYGSNFKLISIADDLIKYHQTPLQKTFGEFLRLAADALYKIEQVQDGDAATGSEEEAIRNVLPIGFELEEAIKTATASVENLEKAIKIAEEFFKENKIRGCHE